MKKHINIALTTLAFVGMMVFASQTAMAASSKSTDNTPDNNTATGVHHSTPSTINDNSIDANNQSAADDVADVEDRQDAADAVSNVAEQASEAADIGDNIDSPADNMELPADDLGVDK